MKKVANTFSVFERCVVPQTIYLILFLLSATLRVCGRERERDRWIVVPRQTERERLACVVRRQSNLVALVPPAFGKDESRRMKLSHF